MGSRSVKTFLVALLLAAPLAWAQTGSVQGEVEIFVVGADGKEQPKADRSGVVVYLTGYTEEPPAEVAVMSQAQKTFMPGVLPIVAGQKVEFLNKDVVLHNVFSRSVARKFDAGKNRPGEKYVETFKKTGIIDVYCDIHEQMVATLVVVPNRAFAVTGKDGRFTLSGVRPGRHPIFAVHRRDEKSDIARAEVVVEAGRTSTARLKLVETRTDDTHLDKRGKKYTPRPDYIEKDR
ncbi:carboxypeptidase regulatory-like domain-containing protein [Pyxidicoccus xibeiensis]|uniref:carboxypeptidase regulatory-like domain-containing protein n=1 Tax=Pyxidicoccus xibeiensis TaxID=2906759 RepID=UPI0020A78297|nr:carboxypeptidase regulatory-like domain-containing protein [Pyxidicoccus xibeiensis]MCP3139554.1 carboxypeptidase regulatory-like domain-containing protein [Pyxidicoccus xibeiensis]